MRMTHPLGLKCLSHCVCEDMESEWTIKCTQGKPSSNVRVTGVFLEKDSQETVKKFRQKVQ